MRHVALLMLIGCGTPTIFQPTPPIPASARSVIFVVETQAKIHAVALSIEDGTVAPAEQSFDRLGRSTIWALFYEDELDTYGLSEGVVVIREDGLPLPEPASLQRSTFLGGQVSDWTSADALSKALRSVRVIRNPHSPCVVLTEERFDLESTANGALLERIDGDTALLGTADGRFYRVTSETVTSLGRASPPFKTGHVDHAGTVYLAGTDGRLFSGNVETMAFTELPRNPSGDTVLQVDGRAGELYAVTASGALDRFDGGWTTLVLGGTETDWRRDVAYVQPGEAVAVGLSAPVIRYAANTASPEDINAAEALTRVFYDPDLGTFVTGDVGGLFFRRPSLDWEMLGTPLDLAATAMARFRGGMIVGGYAGAYVQWYEGHGFCPRANASLAAIKFIAVLDDAIVMLGDPRQDSTFDNNAVTILR